MKARAKPYFGSRRIDSTYERDYVLILNDRKNRGEIRSFYLKPGSFRIGHGCHYEPDFMVISADGTIEFHEVKGATRFAQKSLAKLKAAAAIYPELRFILAMGVVVAAKDPMNLSKKRHLTFNLTEIPE